MKIPAEHKVRLIGTSVFGYTVQEKIWQGGTSTVYRAETSDGDGRFGNPIAVKFLHPYRTEPMQRRQFILEARIMIPLRHPNVVRTFAVGRAGNTLCLAMEYVDGKSLSLLLQERPIPFPALVSILCDAAKGISFVHQRGIVHRDVKPENILVSADLREVKLIDFGYAARLRRPWWEPEPIRGGTEKYASPEQKTGAVDPRSDVYGFGVMLREVLPGRMPAADGSVESVIARAVDPSPARRQQSMADLAADFLGAVRPLLSGDHEDRDIV